MFKKLPLLLLLIVNPCLGAEKLTVVASIQPIHSIVSYLMQGTENQSTALLPAHQSPHTYQLAPKDVKTLSKAALVVWVGPELEYYLQKPIRTLSHKARVLECMRLDDLTRLPASQHHHHHAHPHDDHSGKDDPHLHLSENDPHIWLSPHNARVIAKAISEQLIQLDPEHKTLYQRNRANFLSEVDGLEQAMNQDLAEIKHLPIMVYHDAYAYLSDYFGLEKTWVITENPHAPLSINKLNHAKKLIEENDVQCLFSEPDSSEKIMQQLAKQTGSRTGILDPEGRLIPPGKRAYFELMRSLSHSLRSCLDEDFEQES